MSTEPTVTLPLLLAIRAADVLDRDGSEIGKVLRDAIDEQIYPGAGEPQEDAE